MFPVELKVVAFEYEGQKFDLSFFPNLRACLDAILTRNIGIEGNDIYENKEGVGWKWGLGILLP